MLDAWPALFNLRHRNIHPKWFLYDFVTTETLKRSTSFITIMDTEFIDPFVYKAVKQPTIMPRASLQPSQCDKGYLQVIAPSEAKLLGEYYIESRSHNRLFTVRKVRRTMRLVDIWDQSANSALIGYYNHMRYVKKRIKLVGEIPQDSEIYFRDGRYFRAEIGGGIVININIPVYKHYSNVYGSIVDDLYLFDVVHASRTLIQAAVLPSLRDYIMDIEGALCDDTVPILPDSSEWDWRECDNEEF